MACRLFLRQAFTWTNADSLPIGPQGTNLSEIWIAIIAFSFKKMRLKKSSAKMAAVLFRGRWVDKSLAITSVKWINWCNMKSHICWNVKPLKIYLHWIAWCKAVASPVQKGSTIVFLLSPIHHRKYSIDLLHLQIAFHCTTLCKTGVSQLLMHWRVHSVALYIVPKDW